MPKAKPTQVIVHRIELQEKEREMLETAVTAKALKNLTEPVVAGVTAYVAYKSAKSLHGWADDLFDGIGDRMREQANSVKSGEGGKKEYTNLFGLPGWGIWPGVI